MIDPDIITTIKNANDKLILKVEAGRNITADDVKYLIEEMLNCCDQEEYDFIMERLTEEAW